MGGGTSRLDDSTDSENGRGAGAQDEGETAGAAGRLPEALPASPVAAAQEPPTEAVILSTLVAQLGQEPDKSMALSAIRERLTEMNQPRLRQVAEDVEALRGWLQKFPSLVELAGPPGEEQVRLTVCRAPEARPPPPPGWGGGAADAAGAAPGGAERRCQADGAPARGAAAAALAAAESPEDGLGPCAVQLRGLPFRATIADIRGFLGDHAASLVSAEPSIRLLLNRDGKPSGFARLQFTSPQAAQLCRERLHKQPMGDRYVEVLACVDRTAKTRQRRAAEAGAPAGAPDACGPEGDCDQERVLQECRDHMRAQGPQLLLSMLGIALSDPARNFLRRTNLGLKHFLARHPEEFRVEGPKGGEKVLWAGAGMGHDFQSMMAADPAMQWALAATMRDREPGTPKPPGGPPARAGHAQAGSGGGHSFEGTPSLWGTPPFGGGGGAGTSPPDGAPPAGPGMDFAAALGAGCAWPPYWPSPWDQAWAGWPGEGLDALAGHGESRRGAARGDGAAARSHAHLHPESHPFAHRAPGGASAGDRVAAKGRAASVGNVAALRLRGLPFSVTVQDVLAFFAQHDVVDRIADGPDAAQLLTKANGRPSGQAVVQMRSRKDAEVARDSMHGQYMETRYIEVFVYGGEDGAHGSDSAVTSTLPAGQLPGGAHQWGMGMSPWDPHGVAPMPWELLDGHPRAPGGAAGGPPADGAGPSEPAEWSALFQFLYSDPQPDAGGLGSGDAFLPGGGAQTPAGGGVAAPVPVDMPAQSTTQTMRV